jgi:hypothetical protein
MGPGVGAGVAITAAVAGGLIGLAKLLGAEPTSESLNENFVGLGMVGNIFDREKTDYEIAFEHFTKGTSLNEASAFNTNKLKHIDFVLRPFDKPYKSKFRFNFKDTVTKQMIDGALAAEPNAEGMSYKWVTDAPGAVGVVFKPGSNNSRLTWVFKALDDLYGKYGSSMGWI